MSVLGAISLRLDIVDLLAIVHANEEFKQNLSEEQRTKTTGELLPKIHNFIFQGFDNMRQRQWGTDEPRWFALLKLLHRDLYGKHAKFSGELQVTPNFCLRFEADDLDCALMFYPPEARNLVPLTQEQQQQHHPAQQQAKRTTGKKR